MPETRTPAVGQTPEGAGRPKPPSEVSLAAQPSNPNHPDTPGTESPPEPKGQATPEPQQHTPENPAVARILAAASSLKEKINPPLSRLGLLVSAIGLLILALTGYANEIQAIAQGLENVKILGPITQSVAEFLLQFSLIPPDRIPETVQGLSREYLAAIAIAANTFTAGLMHKSASSEKNIRLRLLQRLIIAMGMVADFLLALEVTKKPDFAILQTFTDEATAVGAAASIKALFTDGNPVAGIKATIKYIQEVYFKTPLDLLELIISIMGGTAVLYTIPEMGAKLYNDVIPGIHRIVNATSDLSTTYTNAIVNQIIERLNIAARQAPEVATRLVDGTARLLKFAIPLTPIVYLGHLGWKRRKQIMSWVAETFPELPKLQERLKTALPRIRKPDQMIQTNPAEAAGNLTDSLQRQIQEVLRRSGIQDPEELQRLIADTMAIINHTHGGQSPPRGQLMQIIAAVLSSSDATKHYRH